MRSLRIPATRVVLAAALMVGSVVGLSQPAHADRGKSWDRPDDRHGDSRHHERRHFDSHPRYGRHHFDPHAHYGRHHFDPARYGRYDGPRGPRYHARPPSAHFESYGGPVFHGSIVFGSAPERLVLAAPVLPSPRIILPPVHFGVTELGRAR